MEIWSASHMAVIHEVGNSYLLYVWMGLQLPYSLHVGAGLYRLSMATT